ncbi:MAG: hypothetical protein ACOX0A_09745 [Thermoguttaceae bacterium]|jgi:hypothetical protein
MSFKIKACSSASAPDAYREWFEQWEKYLPWDERKDAVRDRLESLSQGYRAKFDPRRVMFDAESPLFRRLLYSLTYHWTQMKDAPPTDDEETIKSLETHGRGGSNPLEDLTLADSMLAEIHENRTQAKEYLERRFGGFAVKTARKMGLRVLPNLNECEWWLNAYYSLVGLMGNAPALASYAGRAGVGTWIKMVVYSSNRSKSAPKTFSETVADEEKLQYIVANIPQKNVGSASRLAEAHEFNDSLRAFWLELSPIERALLLYWNEKTPKRFIRVVNAGDYDDAWTISPKDVREAYKLCGVGLKSKKFVLALVERRKAFLRQFDFEPMDSKTFVPLYWNRLVELGREFPIAEEEFAADSRRRFGN